MHNTDGGKPDCRHEGKKFGSHTQKSISRDKHWMAATKLRFRWDCSKTIGYAKFRNRSHDAVIRVYDAAGNVTDDIDGCCMPFNPLELNRAALSDEGSSRREYRTPISFSQVK